MPTEETIVCPQCHGSGPHPVFVDGHRADGRPFGEMRMRDCHVCGGEGTVPVWLAERLAFGRKVRDYRVHVKDETTSDVAHRVGVHPITWNHFEWGTHVADNELRLILAEVAGWQIEGENPWATT